MTLLDIVKIETAGGTQSREGINFAVAEEYAQAYRNGAKMPAVVVFYDGQKYWLADGFHRISAAEDAGLVQIEADIKQGTLQDVVWFSCGANTGHGLHRSIIDKRRAVTRALAHPNAEGLSDGLIAQHCGVSRDLVTGLRPQPAVAASCESKPAESRQRRKGKDGKFRKVKPKVANPEVKVRPAADSTATEPVKSTAEAKPTRGRAFVEDYDQVMQWAIDASDFDASILRLALGLPQVQQDSLLRILQRRPVAA